MSKPDISDRDSRPRGDPLGRAQPGQITTPTRDITPLQSTPAQDIPLLQHVGQIGGGIWTAAVSGSFAYLIEGYALTVLDLHNPARPIRLANLPLPLLATQIQVVDGFAYILFSSNYAYSDLRGSLQIVDVRDPAHPKLQGRSIQPQKPAEELFVMGNRAYLANGDIEILDVSDPNAPKKIGLFTAQGFWFVLVQVAGEFVYAIDRAKGMVVLDVHDPAHPSLHSSHTLGGTIWSSQVVDQRAYLSYTVETFAAHSLGYPIPSHQYRVRVLDVSDPAHLVVLGDYLKPWDRIHISGGLVYSTWGYAGITIFDVSNPITATLRGSFDTPRFANDVSVIGNTAYVADEGDFVIVDVSNPAAPKLQGRYVAPAYVADMQITSNRAFIADSALEIVDLSDPRLPVALADYISTKRIVGVRQAGRFAYLAQRGDIAGLRNSLAILDVSDLAHPVLLGDYDLPGSSFAQIIDFQVVGNYVYFLADDLGLVILDVSDPAHPALRSSVPVPLLAQAGQVQIVGTFAYVGGNDLRILDVSNPDAPKLVATYATPLAVNRMWVTGTRAYLSFNTWPELEMRILDVSDPAHPVLRGTYQYQTDQLIETIQDITVAGDRTFIAIGDGIQILDVSDAARPVLLQTYKTTSGPSLLRIDGDQLYTADNGNGLSILNLSGATIAGRVLDATGMPIAGVSISTDGGRRVTSDADGAYQFVGAPAGEYTLTPSHPGLAFVPASQRMTLQADGGANFVALPAPISKALTPGVPATLSYTDTQGLRTSLEFATGAISQPLTLALTPTLAVGGIGQAWAGHAFELQAQGGAAPAALAFGVPVTVTIQYSARDAGAVSQKGQIALRRWDGTAWTAAACGGSASHDASRRLLRVLICQGGRFALFGPTHTVVLPLVSRSS